MIDRGRVAGIFILRKFECAVGYIEKCWKDAYCRVIRFIQVSCKIYMGILLSELILRRHFYNDFIITSRAAVCTDGLIIIYLFEQSLIKKLHYTTALDSIYSLT